tara:strand:+ start:921 stop:1106 length:186 start_codon:yes stop_codon:yes gene_type:complete
MKIQTKKRSYKLSCHPHLALGLAMGLDQVKRKDRNLRTYTIIILCFLIEIDVTCWNNKNLL